MRRHKFLAMYEGDWTVFDELKEKQMIIEQYDYCTRKSRAGMIYTVSDSERKQKYIAIATNYGLVRTSWNGWKRTRTIYKTMYLLNEEGMRYIKQLIMEERI